MFEHFTASKLGIKPTVILPPNEKAALITLLTTGGIESIRNGIKIDVEKAEASVVADKEKIAAKIKAVHGGFDAVNVSVKESLTGCFSGIISDYITKS